MKLLFSGLFLLLSLLPVISLAQGSALPPDDGTTPGGSAIPPDPTPPHIDPTPTPDPAPDPTPPTGPTSTPPTGGTDTPVSEPRTSNLNVGDTTSITELSSQIPILQTADGEEDEIAQSSNLPLPYIVGGALGLGVIGFFALRSKKKDGDKCTKLVKHLEVKKAELRTSAGGLSIQEQLVEKLQEKIEDKKQDLKDEVKGKVQDKVLEEIDNEVLNTVAEKVGAAQELYEDLLEKKEQAEKLLALLRAKHEKLKIETEQLESDCKICLKDSVMKNIATGGGAEIILPDGGSLKKAYLAGGCFWGLEELFRTQLGVLEITAGYTGGNIDNPTYENHAGHAEALEIGYDASKISFWKLLDFFFQIHNPTTLNKQGNDVGSSYRSAIFYQNDEELEEAKKFIKIVDDSKRWKDPVVTTLEKFEKFWRAEDYHQDYLQKNPNGYTCHAIFFDSYLK
jgi:peptide-methionine (S)-S-oxide reductase